LLWWSRKRKAVALQPGPDHIVLAECFTASEAKRAMYEGAAGVTIVT
jgi:hypothetical protein